MKVLVFLAVVGVVISDDLRLAADNPRVLQNLFNKFRADNHRTYHGAQEARVRMGLFRKFVKEAAKINSEQSDVEVGVTFFADLTEDEKVAYHGANLTGVMEDAEPYVAPEGVQYGSTKSWKSKYGAVKNQGSCASCWAFGAVGTVEGHQSNAVNRYTAMSEQQVLDCSGAGDCYQGGYHKKAFDYIRGRQFLTGSNDYPYRSRKGRCSVSGKPNRLSISISQVHHARGDRNLQSALNKGPVAVLLYNFHGVTVEGYKSGILPATDARPGAMNHIMVAVGYTSSAWEIRNSWGTGWGRGGYFFHSRGSGNNRGVSDWAYTISWRVKRNQEEE